MTLIEHLTLVRKKLALRSIVNITWLMSCSLSSVPSWKVVPRAGMTSKPMAIQNRLAPSASPLL